MEPPARANKKKLSKLYGRMVWAKVKELLPPSTKMLLDQQVQFQMLMEKDFSDFNRTYSLNVADLETDLAVIGASEKWQAMILSRIDIIEQAFYDVRGIKTEVLLLETRGKK